jgi:hypothetical protein
VEVVFFSVTLARIKPLDNLWMAQLTVKGGGDAEPQPARSATMTMPAHSAGETFLTPYFTAARFLRHGEV